MPGLRHADQLWRRLQARSPFEYRVRIHDLAKGTDSRIEFPEPVYGTGLSSNAEYVTDKLRFTYSSLVTPNSVFEYDMASGDRKLLKQQPVLGGYDPSQYASERIWATC